MICGQWVQMEFTLKTIKYLITKGKHQIRLPIRGTIFVVKYNLNNLNLPLLGGEIKIRMKRFYD